MRGAAPQTGRCGHALAQLAPRLVQGLAGVEDEAAALLPDGLFQPVGMQNLPGQRGTALPLLWSDWLAQQ